MAVRSVIHSRTDLSPFVGCVVSCSGRIKEFRQHPSRKDLEAVLLVNVFVTPLNQETIYLDHLWVLRKQLSQAKVLINLGERVHFEAKVYRYRRLGGKSQERGIYGQMDYGLSPIKDNNYEN